MNGSARWLKLALGLGMAGILAGTLVGCDFSAQLNREWNALLVVLRGGSSPLAKRKPKSPPSGKPVNPDDLEEQEEARALKAHQELFYEIYTTVHLRAPDEREFQTFVGVLRQGASLEGIYNGFTHSSNYRRLEVTSGPAEAGAVQVFSEILAGLEAELPVPTEFDATSARPLMVLEANKLAEPAPQAPVLATVEQYSKLFAKASVFTLKRVLGDEALKVIGAKRSDPQKLALWYSKWVAKIAERKVDFGLELRNKPDEQFHYMWAMRAPEDRLKWEVLNRVHRLLKPAEKTEAAKK